jgi:hypothetical protein
MTNPRAVDISSLPGAPRAGDSMSDAAALVDGVDVDAVAAAVRSCPAVSDLFAGRLDEIGSYLPGRRVPGVVVDAQSLTLHVRCRWGIPAATVLDQVAGAVRNLRHGHQLRLVLADIDDPPQEDAGSELSAVSAPSQVPEAADQAPSAATSLPPTESEYR